MPTAPRSPRRWASVIGVLALAAFVGAAAGGMLTYQDLQDGLAALPRTAVPGETAFEVPGPQGVTVFYEEPAPTGSSFVVRAAQDTTLASSPVELTVTGPSGPHELGRYERDLRFDVGERVATALATFDAPEAGTYTLHVAGQAPAAARVSVGDVVHGGLLAGLAGMVGLLVVSLIATAAAVVLALDGRRRTSTPDVAPGHADQREPVARA